MKKTLVALAVTAFAASASAVTVYNQDGSNIEFHGSLRLLLDNGNSKDNGVKTEKHTNLHNDGSRFGVKIKHDIADDFYAIGRVEFRFNNRGVTSEKVKSETVDLQTGTIKREIEKTNNTDQFGDLYAHRAYVGFGSKDFGELTFGRQVLIGDDIAQAGFDNAYEVFDGTLPTSSKSAIRYDYKGIEGLDLSVDYRFAEERDASNNEVLVDKLKSGYSIGGVYNFNIVEGQSATVAAGYARDNYATGTDVKGHKDSYQVGGAYTINDLTLAADYAGSFKKKGDEKERFNGFRVGVKYAVTPEIAVYGNYGHGVTKEKTAGETKEKKVDNRYMLGTEYQVHKNVFTYIEGSIAKTKTTTADGTKKATNKDIGVGLRVSW